jgi:hypothetical protein
MSQEAIGLLTAIRDSLASIDRGIQQLVAQKRAEAPKEIASDRDLDGKFGNPILKFNPRDWTGRPSKGRRFSECPPDLLDIVARTFDWFAEQAEQKRELTDKGKPVAEFKRADAARARGWAKRIREGRYVQAAAESSDAGSDWSEGGGESEWAAGAGDGF